MTCVYLNHVLSDATPLYGGAGKIRILRPRSIFEGDTSNNSDLMFPAHSGTHLDAPRHFDPGGMTLDQYPADFWKAVKPWLINCACSPGEILDLARLRNDLESTPVECDFLLLRTGAEAWRKSDAATYSIRGPGISAEVANWLRRNRKIRFLGIDFISISSFLHRQVGREAHRAFLSSHEAGSKPILLVEDMALSHLAEAPVEILVVPLLFRDADGAPVTVIAKIAGDN